MKKRSPVFIFLFLLIACGSPKPAESPTPKAELAVTQPPITTQIPPTIDTRPTPTPWLGTTLPQAVNLCSQAEGSVDIPDKRPVSGGYLILRKEIDENGNGDWYYFDLPQVQAQILEDVHSLVCVVESLSADSTYEDGATGYARYWTIYMINWSSGELLYADTVAASPLHVKFGPGDAYAEEPTEDFISLLNIVSQKGFDFGSGGERIAIAPDGSKLATFNSITDSLELWDTNSGQLIWSVERDNSSGVPSVTPIFTMDSRSIILGTAKGEVQWFDVGNGNVTNIVNDAGEIQGLALSPDGTLLAARNPDQLIILDAVSGSIQQTIDTGYHGESNFSKDTFDLSFSVDNTLLATRSPDTVDIWSLDDGTIVHQVPLIGGTGGFGNRDCVQFLPDGDHLAICSNDEDPAAFALPPMPTLRLWDIATWQETGKIDLIFPGDTSLLASRDGQWLILSTNCKVYLYNADTLELEQTIQAGSSYTCASGTALTMDGKTLWVGYPGFGFISYDIP